MRHICDCGLSYGNLDALMACQNANHGILKPSRERELADALRECMKHVPAYIEERYRSLMKE